MIVTPILLKGHGYALSAAISIRSCTGKLENRLRGSTNPKLLEVSSKGGVTMSKLYLVNIPYNCTDRELHEWVESRGIEVRSMHIVRDLVAGVSPAFGYVELKDETRIKEAVSILNGKRMRNQTILVKEAQVQTTGAAGGSDRKIA
jgi:RNA recognition motif-containing protein